MAIKYVCDKCAAELNGSRIVAMINVNGEEVKVLATGHGMNFHLCLECVKEALNA